MGYVVCMARGDLTDAAWQLVEPLLPPQKPCTKGRPYKLDHRTALNGMLYILRTGAPWRDLPERYGSWNSVYDRMARWKRAGVWERVLQSLQGMAQAGKLPGGTVEWEVCAADSTTVKAHPHAAGARKARAKKGEPAPVRRPVRRRRKDSDAAGEG